MSRHEWKCDVKGCEEIARRYRLYKGDLFKLCTKHEASFENEHMGRRVGFLELDEDDIRYLEEKEAEWEFTRKYPFWESTSKLENGTHKIRIIDKRTDETRSLTIMDEELESFNEACSEIMKNKSLAEYSIDEYIEELRKRMLAEKERERRKHSARYKMRKGDS
jgi:hypothetical protein